MSTRRGPPGGIEATLAAQARRAHRLRLAGRIDRALECVREALRVARDAADDGDRTALACWAELVAIEAGIAIEGGRFDGVLDRLDTAGRQLSATDADLHVRSAAARLQLEAGRVHATQLRPAAACEHFRRALDAPERTTLEGQPAAWLRIRAQGGLGAALAMQAQYAPALAQLEQALAASDGPHLEATRHDRARLLINLGALHFEQHQLEPARQRIEQAIETLQPLLRARRGGARADLGRAWMNLGGIESHAGRLTTALQAYRRSIEALDAAARSAARSGDVMRLRGTRAKASMNLGYALCRAGDFDAAQRHLAIALRRYQPLLASRPALRADLARARVNAARLAERRGQSERAAALHARALQDFESMIRTGAEPHLAGDAANARLGVARAALLAGQARRSARQFTAAMTSLRELTQAGQLHHAHAWLRSWIEQASLLAESPARGGNLAVVQRALLDALQAPPVRPLGGHEEPLPGLSSALDAVLRWSAPGSDSDAPREPAQTLASACLHHLLEQTAQILSGSAPGWLAERAPAMRQWVARLGDAALAQPSAPLAAVQWFLCTRGLRAQRVALADGADPRLDTLRSDIEALTRLEGELLGAARGATPPGTDAEAAGRLLAPGAAAPAVPAQAAQRWQALRERVRARIDDAVRQQILPAQLHLAAQRAREALAPRQAVLFLARLDPARLVALLLTRDGAQARVVVLPPSAQAPCDLLNAVARHALRHDFAALPSRDLDAAAPLPRRIALDHRDAHAAAPADGLALTALRDLEQRIVAPALGEAFDAGCGEVAIVPADDLHLLPWGDVLRACGHRDGSVAVYPNAGAWWHGRQIDTRTAPRWGWLGAADDAAQLPWATLERRLSRRLWRGDGLRVDDGSETGCDIGCEQRAVDTLLVIGHGHRPLDNPAAAGLRLDDGRVLDAGAVIAGRGIERVLLSTCMLGRVDDAFGEPLGFLSSCFAFRASFGVGWMIEVPDEAACLFSLALQFALHQALRNAGPAPRWSAVFHAVCRRIDAGAWPDGFAGWLAAHAAWSAQRPCPSQPPAALRRVLPWVTALGR
jgi:tetratricopeptide (TPR) repeat protein